MKKLLLFTLCAAIPVIASQPDDQKDQPLSVIVEAIATSSSPLIPDHVSQTPSTPSSPFVDQFEGSDDASNHSGVDLAGTYPEEDTREDDRLAIAQGPRGCYSLDIPNYWHAYLTSIKETFTTAWEINNRLALFAHTEQMRTASFPLMQVLQKMFSNPEAKKHLGRLDDYTYEQKGYRQDTDLTESAQHARSLVWKIARTLQAVNAFDADKLLPLLHQCNDQEATFRLYSNPSAPSSSSTSSTSQTDLQEYTERVVLENTLDKIKEARKKLQTQQRERSLADQRRSFKLNGPTQPLEAQRKKERDRVKRNLNAESPTKQPRLQFANPPKK